MDAMTELKSIIDGYYSDELDCEEIAGRLSRIQSYVNGDGVKRAVAGYYDNTLEVSEMIQLASTSL